MLGSARLPLPQAPTWCRVKNPQYATNTHMLVCLPDLKRTPRLRPTPTHCRVANLQYAADTAAAILPAYEVALGVPYPLEKLDLVAIPDFSAGAMENWGEALGRLVRSLLWCVIVAAYFSSKSSRVWCGGRGFVPLLRHALKSSVDGGIAMAQLWGIARSQLPRLTNRGSHMARGHPILQVYLAVEPVPPTTPSLSFVVCRCDHVPRGRPAGQPHQLPSRPALHCGGGGP